MKWIDKLPRRIDTKERCVGIDDQGNRCRGRAVIEDHLHGKDDFPRHYVGWVRIALCRACFDSVVLQQCGDEDSFDKLLDPSVQVLSADGTCLKN